MSTTTKPTTDERSTFEFWMAEEVRWREFQARALRFRDYDGADRAQEERWRALDQAAKILREGRAR
jgi:hypothetical protein